MTERRAGSVRRRELTQLQRKAIRLLIGEPGVTFQSVADRLHVDRSAVSRWVHHDELFKAELEAARTAPKERLTAEDALERLAPGEQERLAALLHENGGPGTRSRLGKLREFLATINSQDDREDIVCELFDVLGDTMLGWGFATSTEVTDVCRGLLGIYTKEIKRYKEIARLDWSVRRLSSEHLQNQEPEYDPVMLAAEADVNKELAVLDEIENGDGQGGHEQHRDRLGRRMGGTKRRGVRTCMCAKGPNTSPRILCLQIE